jgi:hypothetical protein
MKSSVTSRLRFLGKSFIILLVTQCLVWCTTGVPVGASSDQLSAAISQAKLTHMINASINVNNLPSTVTPSLSTLANGGDLGSTLDGGACGNINVSA